MSLKRLNAVSALALTTTIGAQQLPGDVLGESKVSALSGDFTGQLDDGDEFGSALAALGDLNGDTVIDMAVGAPRDDDGGPNTGAVWILLRFPDGSVRHQRKISQVQSEFSGALDDVDLFGSALAFVGDVDGDGVGDLAVGAPGDDDGALDGGAVWIVFLQPDGTVKDHQVINAFLGSTATHFGRALAPLGDVDADGVPDLAVSSPDWTLSGAFGVLLLNADGTVKLAHQIDAGAGGLTGPIALGDDFGIALAALGDDGNDGVVDLAVGARRDDDGGATMSANRGPYWTLRLNGSTWLDEEAGLLAPALEGMGTLLPWDDVQLIITKGNPDSLTWLILGAQPLFEPFFGGTLVPTPDVVLDPFLLDGNGAASITGAWPGNLPDGFTLWLQAWVADPAGPFGFSATNGLSARSPRTDN